MLRIISPSRSGRWSRSTSAARAGSHWVLCCRLLPTPPNSTPQLAFLRRLTDWFRAVAPGVLGVPKHLADVSRRGCRLSSRGPARAGRHPELERWRRRATPTRRPSRRSVGRGPRSRWRSTSTRSSSAGRRPTRWTWGRWVPHSPSPQNELDSWTPQRFPSSGNTLRSGESWTRSPGAAGPVGVGSMPAAKVPRRGRGALRGGARRA